MKYSDYEVAFSPARLSRYLNACGGDQVKALTLYRHNVKLCQKFYGVLNVFEVVLRNAINEHYKNHFEDNDWIRTQIQSGGMLASCPQLAEVNKQIRSWTMQVVTHMTAWSPLSASDFGHICLTKYLFAKATNHC